MIINYDLDKNISSIIHKNLYFIKKYPVNVSSLNSLRERDWEALTSLFDRDDSDEIEDEIKSKLVWLVPEPCWEDNPFELLREFL
jgi:hypothetical protein